VKRAIERERFDVLHLHEPMTPAICVATLALARCPIVATFHASGELGWMRFGVQIWGFLMSRIDHRIAVSEQARDSAARWLPGSFEIVPNGVLIPPSAEAGSREHRVVFVGRHEPRKGLHVLLRAWPAIHRATGATLRVVGAEPMAVGLLRRQVGVGPEGIECVGFLSQDDLTRELLSAKALVAPSVGGESFGMVLTRGFACALPVVASDIPGYRDVMRGDTGLTVPPGDPEALAQAVVALLEDESRRQQLGAAARVVAEERYSWDEIAQRLAGIYELVTGRARAGVVR
jgi:phosphatidylinositol alpha-mannosyltransferase